MARNKGPARREYRRDPGGKRPPRPLTSDDVVRAALDLLDEVGPSGFTMRAVATRLDTYPATVYWHVGNRNQLLARAVDHALEQIEVPDPAVMPWRDWLAQVARAYRGVLHRHPNLAGLVASQLILAVLNHAGFEGASLAHAYNTYVGSLVGWVSVELSADPGEAGEGWQEEFAATVRELPAAEYPTIAANVEHLADSIIALRWHGGAERPMDSSFEAALGAWLSGLASQMPGDRS